MLESLRYALDIPFGEKAQDKDYKKELLPYVLKSGGKVVVEVTDRHGASYEIVRILEHSPDVYAGGTRREGVSIRETLVRKPLYFGQKDLGAAGKGFGHDLVEKLVGESLKPVRQKIVAAQLALKSAVEALQTVESDVEEKQECETRLADVNFRFEQFDKYGVQQTLEKQVAFNNDIAYCEEVDSLSEAWRAELSSAAELAAENFEGLAEPSSAHNAGLFEAYREPLTAMRQTITQAKAIVANIVTLQQQLAGLREQIKAKKDDLKEEFAETERELLTALEASGVTSIQPDTYVELVATRTELTRKIDELDRRTAKAKTKQDALLAALAELNEAWHEEYKIIGAALDKINSAQTALKIKSVFKGDKAALEQRLEATLKGHNIRKETYTTLAASYPDCGQMYKKLDKAASHAKGKATTFKEEFSKRLIELIGFQVPNSYDVTYHGKPLKSHSLGQRASAMMLFLLSSRMKTTCCSSTSLKTTSTAKRSTRKW